MAGLGDDLAERGAAKRIVRMDRDPQPARKRNIISHFAHAARRSAMVVWTVMTAPPRIRRTSALRPMLSPPK
jgi:hypothetical protein